MQSPREANPAVRRFRIVMAVSWFVKIAVAVVFVLFLVKFLGGF